MKLMIMMLYSLNIFANFDCPNIRLDKDFLGGKPKNEAKYKTMSHAPVRYQKLGICYSHSAAQLGEAIVAKRKLERGQNPTSQKISAIHIAVNDTDDWSGNVSHKKNGSIDGLPLEGGNLCNAFNNLKKMGACPESQIEDFFKQKNINEYQLFEKINQFEKKLRAEYLSLQIAKQAEYRRDISLISTRPSKHSDTTWDQTYSSRESSKRISYHFVNTEINACYKSKQSDLYDEYQKLFSNILPISREAFLLNFDLDNLNNQSDLSFIFNSVCPERKRVKVDTNSDCKEETVNLLSDDYKITKRIIKELREDSLPVGIRYCAYMLSGEKGYRGLASRISGGTIKKKGEDDLCGKHSSLAIGSRFNPNTKSCEILIRNTWGTGCYSYKKAFPDEKSLIKTKGAGNFSNYDVKCENGSVWVDYKDLEANSYGVQYL